MEGHYFFSPANIFSSLWLSTDGLSSLFMCIICLSAHETELFEIQSFVRDITDISPCLFPCLSPDFFFFCHPEGFNF